MCSHRRTSEETLRKLVFVIDCGGHSGYPFVRAMEYSHNLESAHGLRLLFVELVLILALALSVEEFASTSAEVL